MDCRLSLISLAWCWWYYLSLCQYRGQHGPRLQGCSKALPAFCCCAGLKACSEASWDACPASLSQAGRCAYAMPPTASSTAGGTAPHVLLGSGEREVSLSEVGCSQVFHFGKASSGWRAVQDSNA